jgi:HAD superfamily hydrolase (TIGR01548 family)
MENGEFIRKKNIILKSEILEDLKKVDTIIFDIDGVLINVKNSFRKVIISTVNFYFSNFLGWEGKGELLKLEDTELFKLAGGFNCDWNLTYACIIFYLAMAEKLKIKNIKILSELRNKLPEFTKNIKETGGGLENAKKIALSSLSETQKRKILKLADFNTIKEIFQEFYAGDKLKEVYGISPKYIKNSKRFYKREKILINLSLPENFKYGIITGRTSGEVKLALEALGWKDFNRKNIICQDDGIVKTNPLSLVRISKRLKSKSGIYVGDTVDDLILVKNYQKRKSKPYFFSSLVLSGAGGSKNRDVFLKMSPDILCKDVNVLLKFLSGEQKK